MNEERRCSFTIVTLDGKTETFQCDRTKGCLRNLVWSIGVGNAAAIVLDKEEKGIQAYVKGSCKEEPFPHH
jgi:hypothetical protein